MSSFGNLFAMKNQAQGGTGLAGIPTWKLLAASALSNIGKPGTGLNPLQLIMAQKDAQQEQNQLLAQQQLFGQLSQISQPRNLAQQAFSPSTNDMVQTALTAGMPEVALKLSGADKILNPLKPQAPIKGSPGDKFFDPVTNQELFSVPTEPKPITNPKDAAFLQWSVLNPNKNPAEFEAAWNSATRAPDPSKDIFSPENIIKNERELRAEVKPINDAITAARDSIRTLNNYFEQGGPLAINYVIKQFERANEEGAIVRESDVEFIQSAQSRLDQLKSMMGQMKTGQPISEALKAELRQLSERLLEAKEATFQSKVNEYAPIVQQYKGTLENVFTPLRTASPRMKPNQSASSFDWQGQMLGDGWSEINGVPIRRVK